MRNVSKSVLCYVLMPFSHEHQGTYDNAIKPAVSDAATCYGSAIQCLRADEIAGPGSITREIIKSIWKANAIIADLTGNNPNVFYELGVAHSVGNKTITIAQDREKIPFDVHAYRLVEYSPSSEGLLKLRRDLAGAVTEVLTGRGEPSNPVQDFAPIRYGSVVIPFSELLLFEAEAVNDVWIIEPKIEADLKLFRNIIKNNVENRSVRYRYLVPDAPDLTRSVRRFRELLGVDDAAWRRITIRTIEPHMVESEVTIYDAFTDKERVLIMSPIEDEQPFWFPVRGSRALAIRDRYEKLWEELSKPLVEMA